MTDLFKPTFIRAGVPINKARPPTSIRPPTEATQATLVDVVETEDWVTLQTSHDIGLPDAASGDLVLVLASLRAGSGTINETLPAGFTALESEDSSAFSAVWFYKVSDGTEGNTVAITTDINTEMSSIAWVLRGGPDWSTFPPDSAVIVQSWDAPSVTVSHGSGTYMVFVSAGYMRYDGISGPTGYSQVARQEASASLFSPASYVASASKTVTSSENPGTVSFANQAGSSRHRITATIAVLVDGGAELATGDHTHTESDVTDLDHWTETDHDLLDHTGLTGVASTSHTHASTDLADPAAYTDLLVDTARITNSGLTLSINTPTKDAGNPLFPTSAEATGAWDRDKGYVSVIKNDDGWHMFYTGFDTAATARTGYATSTDGVTWTKPNLGLVTYDGNTNNNILRAGFNGHTVYDPTSAKWVSIQEEAGAAPRDLHLWTQDNPTDAPTLVRTLTPAEASGLGEGRSLVRRPSDGRWIVYYTAGHGTDSRSTYAIISDTPDLLGSWTEYGLLATMSSPASTNQFYSLFPSVVGQVILGTVHRYNATSEQVWTDLYYSLDGIEWTALDANWVDPGAGGAWDDEMVFVGPLVVEDDEWHFYYSGAPEDHATFPRDSRIGRVTIDRGRIGQATGTGTVTTDYFHVAPGATLVVDADGSGGSVKIEVQDLDGNAVTGFATADFDTIDTAAFDHYATWGQQTIPAGTYRLVFTLTTATLYGFEISDASDAVTTGGGASAFNDLTDVTLTGFADGQGVFYRASTSRWENARSPEPLTSETPDILYLEDGSVAMSEPFFD